VQRLQIGIVFLSILVLFGCQAEEEMGAGQPQLLIRCDDIGMNHSVNIAAERLSQTGIPFSASVMVACPWFEEAANLLEGKEHISVGVHLTLNSEWQNYRWGPVLGQIAVPSLVDENGYFWSTTIQFLKNEPRAKEVRRELKAQIDKALCSGLQVDYVDYHMGTAVSTQEFRDIVEGLAKEYNLGIARYFGETYGTGIYAADPGAKLDSLITLVEHFDPNKTYLQVFHIGTDNPEMQALIDYNPHGLANMAAHRQAELDALIAPNFVMALERNGVRLVNYRSLIEEIGLGKMERPEDLHY